MALNELIDRIEAGNILDINARTVPRLADKGLLERVRDGHKIKYDKNEVELLKTKLDARKELNPNIKEIYVLKQCGLKDWQILEEFEIGSIDKIEHALELYRCEREGYLNKFGIDGGEHEYLVLVEEATARLKITDRHVIYDLIKQGELKAKKISFEGTDRYFIYLKSLKDFLGGYFSELLYRSYHAAKVLKKAIREVDRIAHENGIGFKLKGTKQGNYLFSSADINRMERLKGKH